MHKGNDLIARLHRLLHQRQLGEVGIAQQLCFLVTAVEQHRQDRFIIGGKGIRTGVHGTAVVSHHHFLAQGSMVGVAHHVLKGLLAKG